MPKDLPLYNAEKLKGKATLFGKGVKYVGVENLDGENGAKGYRAVYAFKDVTALTVRDDASAQSKKSDNAQIMTFKFKKGKRPTLTINIKYPDKKKTDEKPSDTAKKERPEPDPERLKELRELLAGMNFELQIHVAGEITKTNATHVNAAKNGITMMKMDIGKIVMDDALLRRFEGLGNIQSKEEAKALLKEFPHIALETQEKVTVQFK